MRGARLLATLGPLADEIEVFPAAIIRATEDNIPFSFAFSIPVSTPGLKLICRDSYDQGKSHFDVQISSRFEELDAVVIVENVLVPCERLFMYGEPEIDNQAFDRTNAVVHIMYQVTAAKLAKSEFLVGLMCSIARATGKDSDLNIKT